MSQDISTTRRAEEIREETGCSWEIACQRSEDERDVAAVLRRENVTEPSGEWSADDVATVLDPEAREPRSMYDTGEETWARPEYVKRAERAIAGLGVSGRYVGGTSGQLYSL